MKNKNRRQLLGQILSKSNQLMEGIVELTAQMYPTKPTHANFDKTLFMLHDSIAAIKAKGNIQL
jgi:hypothetical protein